MQLTDVGLISHLVAAIGFAATALIVLWRRQLGEVSVWLAGASLVTALWAVNFIMAARFGGLYATLLSPAETLRSAAWIALLVVVLQASWRLDERQRSAFVVAAAIGFVVALQLALDVVRSFGGEAAMLRAGPSAVTQLFVVSRLIVAITGLVLVHNLYVNAAPANRVGVRLVCIGLAGFFGYDLNLYTLQFSLGELSGDLYNIRGAVDAIVVPLLLLAANRSWTARVYVSRQVVFHTLSFSIIGGYLIVMSLTAYGLRLVGGDWGRLLQITFLFSTIILGAVIIISPRFRARLRVLISKHFFAYRYDYRQEWLRFIATVSGTGKVAGQLAERVVEGVCTVIESPGGALYALADDGTYAVSGHWNWLDFGGGPIAADSRLVRFLAERRRVINFDELRADTGDYGDLELPDWAIADNRPWLAVPLLHLDRLAGCLVIERTLVPRELNWEDYDLLRTLGRQAASYIAEASSQAALDEAAKFDEFNRRFAFIMHDIKNLVSQLSLVSRNAERHADNPAFRADMVATLHSSVAKMNDLLARLAPRDGGRSNEQWIEVDIAALLDQLVRARRRNHPGLTLTVPAPLFVTGDPNRLEQLFVHLVQNAIDASPAGGIVHVEARQIGGEQVVRIADHGVGMSPAFIRNELFKPFHSTKPGGFGIGAYEAREIVRGLGGRLDVASRTGEGTLFTITLPAAAAPPQRLTA